MTEARQPGWSAALTRPIAARVPERWHPAAWVTIKLIHTGAFLSIASLVGIVAWDGLHQRPRRRTVVGAAVGLGEAVVYLSNNQVCPLTPLAEALGARSGTVTDMFLPDWVSKRVPVVSGLTLVVGVLLNLRAATRPSARVLAPRGIQGRYPGP
jgi:hypothetical protein